MLLIAILVAATLVTFLAVAAAMSIGLLLQRRTLKHRCADCDCVPGADQAGGVCLTKRR